MAEIGTATVTVRVEPQQSTAEAILETLQEIREELRLIREHQENVPAQVFNVTTGLTEDKVEEAIRWALYSRIASTDV